MLELITTLRIKWPINKLNPNQKSAIEFKNGPLLVIAGAGTGKTTVITERIKHLNLK